MEDILVTCYKQMCLDERNRWLFDIFKRLPICTLIIDNIEYKHTNKSEMKWFERIMKYIMNSKTEDVQSYYIKMYAYRCKKLYPYHKDDCIFNSPILLMYTLLDNVKKYTYTELFDKLVLGNIRQIYCKILIQSSFNEIQQQDKQCYKKNVRQKIA